MTTSSTLFAQRIAVIARFELRIPLENAICLIPCEGERADAMTQILRPLCRCVDRSVQAKTKYDLVVLTQEFDCSSLRDVSHCETLVLDAACAGGHRGFFDASLPFRQVRVASIGENRSLGR